jgi:hypothetical protein
MGTVPNRVECDRRIVRIACSRQIRRRGRSTRCSPTLKLISGSGRNYRRKSKRYTIGLCLTCRRTATAVCIVAYGIGLHDLFGITAIVTNGYGLTARGSACEVVCFIACTTDHRSTSGAIRIILMLSAAISLILGSFGVRTIFIGGIVAVVTILCSAVLTCRIIDPIAVAIRAVGRTC